MHFNMCYMCVCTESYYASLLCYRCVISVEVVVDVNFECYYEASVKQSYFLLYDC